MWKLITYLVISIFSAELSGNVLPDSYSINLIFGDFASGDLTFNGNVNIVLDVKTDVDEILLNCHTSLQISNASLFEMERGRPIYINFSISFDETHELLIITPKQKLSSGSYPRLNIDYRGVISDEETPLGIYRGSYFDYWSQKRYSLLRYLSS